MKDITQYIESVLDNLVLESHLIIKDDDALEEVSKAILSNLSFIKDGTVYSHNNGRWVVSNTEKDLPFSYSSTFIDGDVIIDKGRSVNLLPIVKRIKEDLPEVSTSVHAIYDLVVDVYDRDNKVFTSRDEVEISLIRDEYLMEIKKKGSRWVVKDYIDRYSDLDLQDFPISHRDIEDNPRYKGLDFDIVKGSRSRSKMKMKPDKRFSTLELESKKVESEALLFQQDTQQDQVQTKTATQKLGKQVSTQQVSKSIQSQVDKMSYQKAYDVVEDAMKAWDDTDAYDQYTDTVELASKWYGNGLVLVDGFDVIDKIYYAADLMRKISSLEDSIANTKSRTNIVKLKKELDQVKKDLSNIIPQIQNKLKGAKGYDAVESKAKELEDKMDDYIEDYQSNLSEWKSLKDKMEKAGKLVETMEAIKNKYVSQYDLPPLLSRYQSLMQTDIPTIIDVESLDSVNLNAVYTAWRESMRSYRKELESFTDSMRQNYETLSRLLALKSKSKSLF